MAGRSDLWGGADPYERYMGRWSRRVAPTFLDWLGMPPGRDWVDVGCGTGALSSAIIDRCEPASVVGIDRTAQFLDVARARIQDERFETIVADADALPNHDGAFGAAVSGLVLNFVADKDRAVAEMVRVTRPGGSVGLYVWDYAGHMQAMRHFFDVATQLDPASSRFDDGLNAPVCRP
ncbi:MAG TPA: methyltransferase domain-containing protein, partial [Trueperaceae bacterium]|nr:methyltransferase domain-containing protein [Trueperaceae bacterium]